MSALTLGVSVETGLAAIIAGGVGVLTGGFKKLGQWLVGILIPVLVVGGLLVSQGAFYPAVSQISFYAKAFSLGYFNQAVERPVLESMMNWRQVDKFLSSTGGLWELATWGLGLVMVFILYKLLNKSLGINDRLVGLIGLYSLVLSRAAMGRSDGYHLLFLLIPVMICMAYVVERWQKEGKTRNAILAFWFAMIMIFNREAVMQKFLGTQVFKLISYANISQNYLVYTSPRAGIALDIDAPAKETDGLVEYIQQHTSKSDKIFAYPWKPELYFMTNRNNATKFDTPFAFFSEEYQKEIVNELKTNNPKYVIFNPDMNFGGMNAASLPLVHDYILANYRKVFSFGKEGVMEIK
jgi:hypothetical protein